MMIFTPSTTETRESRGKGAVVVELSNMGGGVGIGTLRMRTDDQKAVYATRRGTKMSMVNISRSARQ